MVEEKNSSGFKPFLDSLFQECARARIDKNIGVWFDLLDIISINLSTEMSKDQILYCREKGISLLPIVNKLSADNESKGYNLIPFELSNVLREWEIFLRQIRKESGLQQFVVKNKKRFT